MNWKATLYADTETFSPVPIERGTHRYAEEAEVMLWPYAVDDGPVKLWDLTDGSSMPAELEDHLYDERVLQVWHNGGAFDRTVLRHAMQIELPLERIHDTMVQALMHSLPGSLGLLCDIMGVPLDKAKDRGGKELIQLFCKPRPKNMKLRRATKETHPVEWEAFRQYAKLDIESMRVLKRKLPTWNMSDYEQTLWRYDQVMNDRGFACDMQLVEAALRTVDNEQKRLSARTHEHTDGEVQSTRQRDALLAHLLKAYGLELPDVRRSTVEKMLQDERLDDGVKLLLSIRQQASTASTAKYKALQGSVSQDGRLRGTIQFCGASRTGRDAGRIFQPQNITRGKSPPALVEQYIAGIKGGWIDMLTDNVMQASSDCLRGAIVARPGYKLIMADLSNIEGRVLAWLAGEEWKLQAFREYDAGTGHDLYKIGAGRILGKRPEDIGKNERQVYGKVPELALGFGGAVGAFQSMAAIYGVEMAESKMLEIIKGYRKANAAIVRFWYALDDAAKRAITTPGVEIPVGRVVVVRHKAWLKIRLPSGRFLSYAAPKIEDGRITYMGVNGYTRKWERIDTYGGKLAENLTQAAARDVLFHSIPLAEEAGYPVLLRVHDELITEVVDSPEFTSDNLSLIMATNPEWAKGLPLAAAGFEAYRYAKEQ